MTVPADAVAQVASLRTTPRQARGREKLERMLAAADAIMATDGADAITTTRVAAAAGVSVGTVYRYLPHRGAIIEALARYYLGLLESSMDALADSLKTDTGGWEAMVDAAVDAFAAFYRDHAGFRTLWFGPQLTPEIARLDRAHKLAMAHRIRAILVRVGLGRDDEATLRVAHVVQLSADAVLQEAFRADDHGDAALLDQVKTLVRAYLAAGPVLDGSLTGAGCAGRCAPGPGSGRSPGR